MNPADDIRIAPATSVDTPQLVELMGAFYGESRMPLDGSWAAPAFDMLLAQPALGRVWIATVSTRAAGYIVLSMRYAMEHGAPVGHIDDLYVRPAYRRQGVAGQLIEALAGDCRRRGGRSLYVEVSDANLAALRLYARHGLHPAADGRLLVSGMIDS